MPYAGRVAGGAGHHHRYVHQPGIALWSLHEPELLLANVVNPSAFYIVIQSVLLCSNVGATLGVDAFLSKHIRSVFIVAQPEFKPQDRIFEKWCFLLLAVLSRSTALWVIPFIRDYSPYSVDDPAMLLFILSWLSCLLLLILFLRMIGRSATITK